MLSCSRSLKPWPLLPALGLAFFGLTPPPPASAQVAVLTQNGDNARTGANTYEPTLTPANVNSATFGKLFTLKLDASVNGQVLYVPGVFINGAQHNVVYAYTSNNRNNSACSLWAYDADTANQTTPLWHTTFTNAAEFTTATPVIDALTSTIYVLTKDAGPASDQDAGATYLHAIDITTGKDRTGSPVQIQASAPGTGDGSVNGTVYFDGNHGNGTFHANDRAGLLLLNGVVYTSFAFNTDAPPYHGWVLGYTYNGSGFTQKYVFCTTPNGSDGGIWMSGKGLMADAAGNIYFAIGNGKFDANTNGADYGMCYMKLTPNPSTSKLSVASYYTPYDEQAQSNSDLDDGNSGPVGIPGTTSLFAGATKFGSGFLLSSANLGGFPASASAETAIQRLNGLSGNDNVGQNPVAWDSGTYKYVYLWPRSQNIEQLRYDPSVSNFSPPGTGHSSAFPANVYAQSSGTTSGGSLAVSSRGTANAILWAVGPADSSGGVVHAFNASDVSQPELWNSSMNTTRDALGGTGHFQFPTVANGKVYVPNGAPGITVYGLLSNPAPSLPVFRLYAPFISDHFYTVNGAEESAAAEEGYGLEFVIGYAPAFGSAGAAAVYRLYQPSYGDHFYTTSPSEVGYAENYGYVAEGIGFDVLSGTTAGVPLYRLYSPSGGKHFYTTSTDEYTYLVNSGKWTAEGVLGSLSAP